MTTTTLSPREQFRQTVALVAARAAEKLPQAVNGRVASAVKLVLAGDVLFCDDGTVEVGSSDPTRYYKLIGPTCTCTDFTQGKAPESWCKHRIAANLQHSVERVLARRGLPAVTSNGTSGPPVPVQADTPPATQTPAGLDPRFVVLIQGKPFVRFAGLLALANARGLVSLETTVVSVADGLVVCQSVARFEGGRTFTEIGDASPENVAKHLRPHYPRMAATRAAARALRRALAVGEAAVEELGDEIAA